MRNEQLPALTGVAAVGRRRGPPPGRPTELVRIPSEAADLVREAAARLGTTLVDYLGRVVSERARIDLAGPGDGPSPPRPPRR